MTVVSNCDFMCTGVSLIDSFSITGAGGNIGTVLHAVPTQHVTVVTNGVSGEVVHESSGKCLFQSNVNLHCLVTNSELGLSELIWYLLSDKYGVGNHVGGHQLIVSEEQSLSPPTTYSAPVIVQTSYSNYR